MARFINAVRSRGILRNKEIEVVEKENPYKDLMKKERLHDGNNFNYKICLFLEIYKTELLYNVNQPIIPTENFEIMEEEDKKFWMNILKPSKKEENVVSQMKFRLKIFELLIALGSFFSVIITQFEYEVEYQPKNYYCILEDCTYKGMGVRVFTSFICFCLASMTIYCSYLSYRIKREERKIINTAFYRSYFFRRMLIELIIDLIHPVPYVDYTIQVRLLGQDIMYKLMTFLYALMFLKLYSVIRIAAAYTSYSNKLSAKYCEMYGGEADTIFALKAVQKDSPFLILSCAFCSISVILGILLRMFELLDIGGGGSINYEFYTNGIWNIIIIMTTIGYGDYFPKTHIGRFISVITIVLGTLLVSLTIVALNGVIEFNPNEKQAFIILHRTAMRRKLHDTCQAIIRNNYMLHKLREQYDYDNKILLAKVEYMSIIRKLKVLGKKKLYLQRELSRDSFLITEEKFIALNDRIDEEIFHVNESFKLMKEYKLKLKLQLKQQKQLITNVENSLKIMRNHIKPSFYKLMASNPELLDSEKSKEIEKEIKNFKLGNKEIAKETAMKQIEFLLFQGPPKLEPTSAIKNVKEEANKRLSIESKKIEYFHFMSNEYNNLIIKNVLAKKVSETFKEYVEKYANNLSESLLSADIEKDPVKVEFEKIQNLDNKTRQIYNRTSKKTLDLLHSLNEIKNKNKNLFGKGKSKDNLGLPAPIDLLENLFEGEESDNEPTNKNYGKPLFNKLTQNKLGTNPQEVDEEESQEESRNHSLEKEKSRISNLKHPEGFNTDSFIKGKKTQLDSQTVKNNSPPITNMIKNFAERENQPVQSNGLNKSSNMIDIGINDLSRSNFNLQPKDANKDFLNSINDAFSINMNSNFKNPVKNETILDNSNEKK